MKIARRAVINRESERCREFALPYIMNNSAQVLGTEFTGNLGALRYNFVGIGGENSQLKWLAHFYQNWPASRLEPLFDKIFQQILKPWYGQPLDETIYPYRDHDPTATFFPGLCESAEAHFGISADDRELEINQEGLKAVNPYWFLKYEYPARRNMAIPYRTAICHGDLNMQNILLDEDMNVYLIDFSETRSRSLISDFARLEAIFMIEHAVMDQPGDIEEYVKFLTEFYSVVDFSASPANNYQGILKEQVDKNVAMTLKMREYARAGSGGDSNMEPYCLALLEWVLPVVCYTAPAASKRYSMVVAACLSGILSKL
jgi:hypothetical protein